MDTSKIKILKRPEILNGTTYKAKTSCGNIYVIINHTEDYIPYEVFIRIGKAGACLSSQSEALARVISLCLQNSVEIPLITKHLKGISCHAMQHTSCSDVIGKLLERAWEELNKKRKGIVCDTPQTRLPEPIKDSVA